LIECTDVALLLVSIPVSRSPLAHHLHQGKWTLKPSFPAITCNDLMQVDELQSGNAVIRAKAVVAARELLVAPTKHIQCIAAGITQALIRLLDVSARP
jgi:hypothetical protein